MQNIKKESDKSVVSSQNKENSLSKEKIISKLKEREDQINKLNTSELSIKIEENLNEIVKTVKNRKENFLKYLDMENKKNINLNEKLKKKNIEMKKRQTVFLDPDNSETKINDINLKTNQSLKDNLEKRMSLDSETPLNTEFINELKQINMKKEKSFVKLKIDEIKKDFEKCQRQTTFFNIQPISIPEMKVYYNYEKKWKMLFVKFPKEKLILDLKFHILKKIRI